MFLAQEGGGATQEKLYVEDVFSAFNYAGDNGTARDIPNGIDLLTKGGLIVTKNRGSASGAMIWHDTTRGLIKRLASSSTAVQADFSGSSPFTAQTTGYQINSADLEVNQNSNNYISWVFRKAAKFFDVVTYTGNETIRSISHSLGTTPGMIIIKRLNNADNWVVWHRSLTVGNNIYLNTTAAQFAAATRVTGASASDFSIGIDNSVNNTGSTYVAYIFAHDTTSDGSMQCGTLTTDVSGNATVNLGWEPQFILTKASGTTGDWYIVDTAREWNLGTTDKILRPNNSVAEASSSSGAPKADGFTFVGGPSQATIYMAIRKGLMRPPTDATKVFAINARTGTGAVATVTAGSITQGVDLSITKCRSAGFNAIFYDRLRGATAALAVTTAAENAEATGLTTFNMNDVVIGPAGTLNSSGQTFINYLLKQARGFFDIVAYTGTGSAHTEAHNLGVVPELMIIKNKVTGGTAWIVYYGSATDILSLNQNAAAFAYGAFNNTAPTASVFSVGTVAETNESTKGFAALLFASCPGVSKVGTYIGTGAANSIPCGFASGARFVMIKCLSFGGTNWYVWDTTRGIIGGADPHFFLNSSAVEVTTDDNIDPYTGGFQIAGTAPATLNSAGQTYLFFAIA